MGKVMSTNLLCNLYLFFSILAGNKDNHNISDEFKFRPDPIFDCGVSCP